MKSWPIWSKTGTETRANVLFAKNDSFFGCIVSEKVFLLFLILNRKLIKKKYKSLKGNL